MNKRTPRSIKLSNAERPMAALFLNKTEILRDQILNKSRDIHQQYGYLMPENTGAIAQLGQPSDQSDCFLPPFETIILDARQAADGLYVWELAHGDRGARNIQQVTVGPQTAEGIFYQLNSQGLLMDQLEMSEDSLRDNLAHLRNRITSPEVLATIEVKQQEYLKNEQFREVGFAALRPYVPPPPVSPEHVERVLAFWEEYRSVIGRIGLANTHIYVDGIKVPIPEIEEVLIKYGLKRPNIKKF